MLREHFGSMRFVPTYSAQRLGCKFKKKELNIYYDNEMMIHVVLHLVYVIHSLNISHGLSKDSFTTLFFNDQNRLWIVRYSCSGKKNEQNSLHASEKEKKLYCAKRQLSSWIVSVTIRKWFWVFTRKWPDISITDLVASWLST